MSISLYNIEAALQQLVDERERAESEGDGEAVVAIDHALSEYLTREVAKVDSYAGLIHLIEADADEIEIEAKRLYDRAKSMRARRDAIKAAALAAMQAHGVRELKTPRNTMRIQGNGGLQALEIVDWPVDASGNRKPVPYSAGDRRPFPVKLMCVPDTDRIRRALDEGEQFDGIKLLERGEHLRIL